MSIPEEELAQYLREIYNSQEGEEARSGQSSPQKSKKPQKPNRGQVEEQLNEVEETQPIEQSVPEKPEKPHRSGVASASPVLPASSDAAIADSRLQVEQLRGGADDAVPEAAQDIDLPVPEPLASGGSRDLADSQRLESENLSLSANLEKQLQVVKSLQIKHQKAENRYQDLENRFMRVAQQNQAMEEHIIELTRELKLKDRMNSSSRDEINESLNQQGEVKAELARLQMEIKKYKDEAQAAIDEKNKLQQYMQSQEGQSRKERTYAEQIEKLKDENKHLKVDVYKAQKENLRLREGLKEVQLQVQLAKKRQENVQTSKCASASSEIKSVELKKSLLEKSQEVEDLKTEIRKLKSEKVTEKKKLEEQLMQYESQLAQKELQAPQ